jgi:cellobiose phosphorylase
LGEHVPYAVEAYPEGSQRHLSAESGLYCRIFIEGLFGIRPTGFNSFNCTPRLPKNWKQMTLSNIHAFGTVFDVKIAKVNGEKVAVTITKVGIAHTHIINDGETANIKL